MQTKIFLSEEDIPRQWYNLAADLPGTINPPLGQDGQPISPDALAAVFPMNLIEQEMSQERWIDIPEGILDLLYRWRPSPLHRAVHLEKALDTRLKFFIRMRAFPRRAVTSPTPPLPRHGIIRSSASNA